MIVPSKIMQAAIRAYFGEAYNTQTPTAVESVKEKLTPILTAAFEEAAKNETNLYFGNLCADANIKRAESEYRIRDDARLRRSWLEGQWYPDNSPRNRTLYVQMEVQMDNPLAIYIIRNFQSRGRGDT